MECVYSQHLNLYFLDSGHIIRRSPKRARDSLSNNLFKLMHERKEINCDIHEVWTSFLHCLCCEVDGIYND